jgi:hypothetical protein
MVKIFRIVSLVEESDAKLWVIMRLMIQQIVGKIPPHYIRPLYGLDLNSVIFNLRITIQMAGRLTARS